MPISARRTGALALGLVSLCTGWAALGSASTTLPASRRSVLAAAMPVLAETEEPGQPPQLTISADGRALHLVGDLTEGVADRVAALLAAHPRVERLDLTSEGGLVEEALALGTLVAAYALATYVPETCASACTLVFVRGRGRFLAEGGRLGFHGPYELGVFEAVRPVDPAPERTAYLHAGLAPDFVARALAVRAEAMWRPGAARLRAAGVVTASVSGGPVTGRSPRADPAGRRGPTRTAARGRDGRARAGPRIPAEAHRAP